MKEKIVIEDNIDYQIYLKAQKRKNFMFRVFNKTTKEYEKTTLFNLQEGKIENGNEENYVLEKYTGYKDRFGKEIYEGDIVVYYQEITRAINEKDLPFFVEKYVPEGYKKAVGRRKYCLFNGEKYYADYYSDFKTKGTDEDGNWLIVVYTNKFRARKALVSADGWDFAQKGNYGWYRKEKEGQLYLVEIIGNIHKEPEKYNREYKTDMHYADTKERLEYSE